MYLIPVTYLILSTLSPGPVTVLTVHHTTRYGRLAGLSVGCGGAALTAVFAAASAALTHNLSAFNVSTPDTANFYQQGGAIFILVMGLLTGYRSLFSNRQGTIMTPPSNQIVKSFLTGVASMAPYFPQAILFYTVILPHYTTPARLSYTVLLMGLLKIVITIGWHFTLALAAKPIQEWLFAAGVQRYVAFALSCFLVGISVTLFIR